MLNRKQIYLVVAIVAIAVISFTAVKLYELGYRLSFNQGFTRPTTLIVDSFPQGATLLLNDKMVQEAIAEGDDALRLTLGAGVYDIVVARTGYSPWQKTLDIESGERVVVAPFLIPELTNGTVIQIGDADRGPAITALSQITVPTEASPLVSKDGLMQIFLRDGNLMARTTEATPPQYFCVTSCQTEKVVVELAAEVRGVAFLPSRHDVLLIAVQDGIFAIEVDSRGTQNFQVVYRGSRPTFSLSPEGFLYMKDIDSYFKLFLFPATN